MIPKDLSGEEFRKYAVHHRGLNGLAVDQYMNNISDRPIHQIEDMTQYIIEERPMRFAQIDVFSRLITD
jgi:ATP-dependent Clp protease protease subunit